ncbi:MAG TPA: peptidoglycan-associated lipoprotein Pal [Candidatus Krumholzibacteria bacterium]
MKRMLWIAVIVAMTVIAGCGGKKAGDTAPPPVEPTPTPTETVQDIPATNDPVPSAQLDASMIGDVYFDYDSYNLTSEAKSTLEANARALKQVTAGALTIEGHCDERGTKAYNLALGEKRANAAKDFLVALGVDGSRLNTVSYGKERPFDDGHDESAWAKNRRAHFVIGQ